MQHRFLASAPHSVTVLDERILRSADELQDSMLQRFDAIWRSYAQDGLIPSASNLDPAELAEMLGHLMLAQVIRDGAMLRCATVMVGQHHADLFGRTTSANYLQLGGQSEGSHLRDLVDAALPQYERGTVDTATRGTVAFERISYPLASNGLDTDRVISIVAPRYNRQPRMASFLSWF